MQDYVAGFMFSENEQYIALVLKNRPPKQAGKMNGIGGHIEPGEEPINAMVREFEEETSVKTDPSDWRQFCVLTDEKYFRVYFYFTRTNRISDVKTVTDEEIKLVTVNAALTELNVLPNVRWLIPMALSLYKGERSYSFKIIEI